MKTKTTATGIWLTVSLLSLCIGFPETTPLIRQFAFYGFVLLNLYVSGRIYTKLLNEQDR
ncbi:MAG: hypothetical protein K0B15_07260 [Lentimicrobium sp.]|nr:hypothetical protein [Lentimicrobium sp.]